MNENSFGGAVRSHEQPFVRRIRDLAVRVESRGYSQLTDFLTPREQLLTEMVARQSQVAVSFHGGAEATERKRALVMPDEWFSQVDEFEISMLSVTAGTGANLAHGTILGSLLGTGLDRRKIGDIGVFEHGTYLFVCKDIVPFLQSEWRMAGSDSIQVRAVESAVDWTAPLYHSETISVMSLRADAVLAHACHFSRERAQNVINKGAVSLNFVEFSKVDEGVEVGDIFSVRGFGRVKVLGIHGRSKKDRLRVEVGILKSDRH